MAKPAEERDHFFEELEELQRQYGVEAQAIIKKDPLYGCGYRHSQDECFDCYQKHPNEYCDVVQETGLSPAGIIRLRELQDIALNELRAGYRERALKKITTAINPKHIVKAIDRFPELFRE